jgi:hypothetical protein
MNTMTLIPIDENNVDLIKENSLVAYTSTGHPEWRDINHEHFSATICRASPYKMADGTIMLLLNGRSIGHAVKYEKVWLFS